MRENNHLLGKVAFTFVLGGMAGAAVALLFAPQSGARTRRQILRTGEDLSDRIQDFRVDLGQNLDKLVEDSMCRVEKGLQRATEMADKLRKDLEPTLEKGREILTRRAG